MRNKKKVLIVSVLIFVLVLIVASIVVSVVHFKELKRNEELVKQYRQAKIELYVQENEMYGDYEVDVAFLGDSLTDGYNVQEYYPQFTVVNRGIAGDRTFDLEKRLQVSVLDLKPKVAVMLIGANNFKTMFEDYENIVKKLTTEIPNTEIVLLSLTAMGGDHWGTNNKLACYNNVKIELIAKKYGCTFIDLFTPLFDLETGEIYENYTIDGGHLTAEGYKVLTNQITPVLNELLTNN